MLYPATLAILQPKINQLLWVYFCSASCWSIAVFASPLPLGERLSKHLPPRRSAAGIKARGAVLGYDLASGKERARLALPEGTAAMHLLALPENSMAVADDATTLRHLELQRQRRFFRSNTKLMERWASPLSNPAVGGPVELGTSISILTENGRLEMFDARQGHRTGALDLRTGHHQSGGAARSGEFLAVAHGRTVCAYRY